MATQPERIEKITSVSDAIEWAKQVLNDFGFSSPYDQQAPIHVWYRGHKDIKHHLIPGIFRKIPDHVEKIYEEGGMLMQLIRRFPHYRDNCYSTFDILSLMKHYGLPCRLLDWTENVLIALWFAVEENKNHDDKEAKIFALNARLLCPSVEFMHYQRKEHFVYGPEQFHVVLRSELSQTAYLDELLSRPPVRAAASTVGFSSDFWEQLLKITAYFTEKDIELIEEVEKTNWDEIFRSKLNNVPHNFLDNSEYDCQFVSLYNMMPIWLQREYIPVENSDAGIVKAAKRWLFSFIFSIRKPVAVFPERKNIRIAAQSGMFTLAGGDYLPDKLVRKNSGNFECRNPKPIHLDDWDTDACSNFYERKVIVSVKIPKDKKTEIRKELQTIGFNAGSMYPDLDQQIDYIKEFWIVDPRTP
ncbi:MAG: FRG domain-containing protein [Candidatus Contendobacter sp.]|nr:FRG domain-containing protein [Candidatus Contendobacter sp.]